MVEPKKRAPRRSADVQHDQGVRQDQQGVTQTEQGATQTEQGATQTEQGATQVDQGVTQIEQGITQVQQGATQIAQGIKQDAQADAMAAQTFNILAVTEGVQVLALRVETLNERVYAKTQLDRTRNHLLAVSVVTFIVLSLVLGVLLWRIDDSAREDAVQARKRSAEAVASRRALADCTNPPGTVLDNGFINPGLCFIESATRTEAYINDATRMIEDSVRDIVAGLADAVASNTSLTAEVRRAAAAQSRQLRAPPSQPAVLVQQPATPTPPAVPTPTTTIPTRGLLETLLCGLLVLVAAC